MGSLESTVDLSHEYRDKKAAKLGVVIVEPGLRQLFIDLDSEIGEDPTDKFMELLRLARAAEIEVELVKLEPSLSPNCYHAVVQTGFDLTPEFRIALQGALGSDRTRELLSCARILKGIPAPTVFFEKDSSSS